MKGKGQLVVSKLPELRWDGDLTNSARSTFLNCRKKFEWQYLRRLSPRAPSVPFLVGGQFHNELELMYKEGNFDEGEAADRVSEACDKACMETSLTPEQSDKVWEQQALILGMLAGYAKHYLARDLKTWKVLEVEKSFKYPLPNGWNQRGKRDMLVQQRKDGKVVLVEHKTAARVDAHYVAKLPLDSQIIGYAKSVKVERGKAPDGVCYNVARKAQLRKGKKETFEQFAKRLKVEYSLNPGAYFYRATLLFSAQNLVRFETELGLFAKEMQRAIKEQFFYQNTTQCTSMGVCPYMSLCIQGPNRENLSRFRERAQMHEELEEEIDG